MDRIRQHKKSVKLQETMLKEKKHVLPTPVFRFLYYLEARSIQRQRNVQEDRGHFFPSTFRQWKRKLHSNVRQ
eukprot:11499678-Karenia_brevis.AAC.1